MTHYRRLFSKAATQLPRTGLAARVDRHTLARDPTSVAGALGTTRVAFRQSLRLAYLDWRCQGERRFPRRIPRGGFPQCTHQEPLVLAVEYARCADPWRMTGPPTIPPRPPTAASPCPACSLCPRATWWPPWISQTL